MRFLAAEVVAILREECERDPERAQVLVERICRIRPEEGGPRIQLAQAAGTYAVIVLGDPLEIVALAREPAVTRPRDDPQSPDLNRGGDFDDLAA
jgi:hypothetical protein